jgi:hypothetical protein
LFVRTLRVAEDAAVDEKLIALGKAIASGALAYRSVDVQWETAFVGTLSELDRPHLRVLDQVRRLAFDPSATPQQTFPEPASVTEESLHQSLPELRDIIDTVVATLQSHGLLAAVQGQMATIGPTSRRFRWKVTNFGLQFLERMRLVGDTLAQQEDG